jgi:hypothetical protein
VIESSGSTNDKSKPPVKCFSATLEADVMLNGYDAATDAR